MVFQHGAHALCSLGTCAYPGYAALTRKNADVHREFMKGKFIITKTLNLFSKMAIDQAHEPESEKVKGEGGAMGITEDPAALLRWMVAGPEVARVVHEFLAHQEGIFNGKEHLHHDQSPSIQRAFYLDVKSNSECMRDMENPFTEEFPLLHGFHPCRRGKVLQRIRS